MSKIDYNSNKLDLLKSTLTKSLTELDVASNSVSSLDIPSFNYSGWLSSIPGLLSKYKSDINEIIEWIIQTTSTYESYNNESIIAINTIEVPDDFSKELSVNNR
ncbi:MAG: hypothetical protein ACI33S_03185 [Bacilli bacterium]